MIYLYAPLALIALGALHNAPVGAIATAAAILIGGYVLVKWLARKSQAALDAEVKELEDIRRQRKLEGMFK